jgi:hypothetical protein
MYTITKADRRQFRRPQIDPCIKFMWFMAALMPVSYIYYVIDRLVRR